MESFLKSKVEIALDDLYPDPNNPRLGLDDAPGYDNVDKLFSEESRELIFGRLGQDAYGVDELVSAIVGQGWMPIDNILVWQHPGDGGKWVVVEGNRRRLALERIRHDVLPKAERKLARMRDKSGQFTAQDLKAQENLNLRLKKIADDTAVLDVIPVDAESADELDRKLPRVLAVRHITGAKKWGYYAEDLWLLQRYSHLFQGKHEPDTPLTWDDGLIGHVADEACLSPTKTKRQLKSSSWFSHFKAEWEDELPEGQEFRDEDYYLFSLISQKPWVRRQLSIDDQATRIPPEGERVLFDWVFNLPRPRSADDNENVFYRHENIKVWDDMNRYDQKPENNTSFAARFDVEDHENVPRMHEVEAEWLSHKARTKPADVMDSLLRRLKELGAETLVNEGDYFKGMLTELELLTSKYLKMIEAAEG